MRLARVIVPWIGDGTTINPYRPDLSGIEGWVDVTGQAVGMIASGKPPYTVDVTLSDIQLAAIRADARYAVLWDTDADNPTPPADLDTAGLDTLKASIEHVYYSDVSELVTAESSNPAVIGDTLIAEVQLRPSWLVGLVVLVGQVYQYSGNLYEVIQAHTTQADWHPDIVPALFKRFYEPTDDPWPWVQPLGAHDAYPLGARVLHNTYTWQSDYAANVWEPGVFGWTNLTLPPPTQEWQPWTAYVIGDIVTYLGISYSCRQSHTSQPGWEPPNVLALWLPI